MTTSIRVCPINGRLSSYLWGSELNVGRSYHEKETSNPKGTVQRRMRLLSTKKKKNRSFGGGRELFQSNEYTLRRGGSKRDEKRGRSSRSSSSCKAYFVIEGSE